MPTPTLYKPQTDKPGGPPEQESISGGLDSSERAKFADLEKNFYDSGGGPDDDSSNAADAVRAAEQAAGLQASNPMNYSGSENTGKSSARRQIQNLLMKKFLPALAKNKGATGAIGGIVLAAFMGFQGVIGTLPQTLSQMIQDKLNWPSRAAEQRQDRVFKKMVEASGSLCDKMKGLKCKGSSGFTNAGLRKLKKKGVTAYFADGTKYESKLFGRPSQPIKGFTVETNGKLRNIRVEDFPGFLAQSENRALAGKLLGRWGAFKLRTQMATGKYFKKKFYNKWKLLRDGGIASGDLGKKKPEERRKGLFEKVKEKINPADAESPLNTNSKLRQKLERTGTRLKKGGAAYMIAAASCLVSKGASLLTSPLVAQQLAMVISLAHDSILSPGDKLRQMGGGSGYSTADMAAVGDLLMGQAKDSSGKISRPVDAPAFHMAVGATSKKIGVPANVAPGYSILHNPFMQTWRSVEEATKGVCSVILSPAAMYTAMAADIAGTVLASATVIGGIVKVAVGLVVSEVVNLGLQYAFAGVGDEVLKKFAESSLIPQAKGADFGNVLGLGSMAFFSSSAAARHLPILKTGQLSKVAQLYQENEAYQKQLDIASLSPFDTSSKYTFLGSIVHNLGRAAVLNGATNLSPRSLLGNLIRLPSLALAGQPAHAATSEALTNTCSYAAEFDLAIGDKKNPDANTPAISPAGTGCYGFSPEQSRMSATEAEDLLINEGWLDPNIEMPDDADIDKLRELQIIKPDTPLADYIESCGDLSTGDSILNAGGCTSYGRETFSEGGNGTCVSEGSEKACVKKEDLPTVKNPKALAAMSVWLLDFQIAQGMNGQDEEKDDDETTTEAGGDSSPGSLPPAEGKIISPIPNGVKAVMTTKYGYYRSSGKPHYGVDLSAGEDNSWEFVSACDGIVESVRINSAFANQKAFKVVGSTNYVWIKCDNGVHFGYGHWYANKLKPYIKEGARITAGTPIAPQGTQGNSSGPHLHFQLNPSKAGGYSASETRDPAAYLAQFGVQLPKPGY